VKRKCVFFKKKYDCIRRYRNTEFKGRNSGVQWSMSGTRSTDEGFDGKCIKRNRLPGPPVNQKKKTKKESRPQPLSKLKSEPVYGPERGFRISD
jgi:hypothetical protein